MIETKHSEFKKVIRYHWFLDLFLYSCASLIIYSINILDITTRDMIIKLIEKMSA